MNLFQDHISLVSNLQIDVCLCVCVLDWWLRRVLNKKISPLISLTQPSEFVLFSLMHMLCLGTTLNLHMSLSVSKDSQAHLWVLHTGKFKNQKEIKTSSISTFSNFATLLEKHRIISNHILWGYLSEFYLAKSPVKLLQVLNQISLVW